MLYRIHFNILRLVCDAVGKLKIFGIGMSLQPSRCLLTVWRVTCISYLTECHLSYCNVSHHKHFFLSATRWVSKDLRYFRDNCEAGCLTRYIAALGSIRGGSNA